MTGWAELKKLPREIWLLNLANSINRMGSMAFLFLSLYLTKTLSYPIRVAGVLLATFGLTSLLAAPFGGWLCDRLGPRRILFGSMGLGGSLLLLFPLFHDLTSIFFMTVVVACVTEAFSPAMLTYSTATLQPELRKTSIAMGRLSHNLGMSIGPALGGLLAAHSFRYVFWVDGATSLVASAIIFLSIPERLVEAEERSTSFIASARVLSRDGKLAFFLLAGIPVGVAWFQFGTSLPIYLVKELGMGEAQYGFLFTINTLMVVVLEIPLTAQVAHWSASRSLTIAALLFSAGFAILIPGKSYFAVVAMIVVTTFGEMLVSPAGAAYISEISPKGREGAYMGAFTASYCLCSFVAPLIGTWLLASLGGRVLWGGNALLALMSACLYLHVRVKN